MERKHKATEGEGLKERGSGCESDVIIGKQMNSWRGFIDAWGSQSSKRRNQEGISRSVMVSPRTRNKDRLETLKELRGAHGSNENVL